MTVLVIGEARGDERFTEIGGRVRRVVDWLFDGRPWRGVNLLPAQWPAPGGKGHEFDYFEARRNAVALFIMLADRGEWPTKVMLLGRRVCEALWFEEKTFLRPVLFEPLPGRRSIGVALPHPSGVVLWWNSEKNKTRARELVAALSALGPI